MTEKRQFGFGLNYSTLEQDMSKAPPKNPVLEAYKKNDQINLEKDNQIITLKNKVEEIKEKMFEDPLTGCYNRKYWDKFVSDFNPETDRIAMVNIDVDGLKQVNDGPAGHLAGDEYLQNIANYLKEVFNDSTDKVIRTGGDEFLVLSQRGKTGHEAYISFKEFVNNILNQKKLEEIGLFLSHGTSHFTLKTDIGILDTYDRADQRMYSCKNEKKQKSLYIYSNS